MWWGPIQKGDPIEERLKCCAASNLPELSKKALQGCHDDIGHMGLE